MNQFVQAFFRLLGTVMIMAFAFLLLQLVDCSGSGKSLKVFSEFRSISSALERYRTTTGDYPTTEQGLIALVVRPDSLARESAWTPITPQVAKDPWENEYRYRRLAGDDPRHFELRSLGPDGVPSSDDPSSLDAAKMPDLR